MSLNCTTRELDREIYIQSRGTNLLPNGQLDPSDSNWTDVWHCQAKKEESGSARVMKAAQFFTRLDAIFTINWRYDPADSNKKRCGVNEQMRLIYNNQIYQIIKVNEVGDRQRWIEIFVTRFGDQTTTIT